MQLRILSEIVKKFRDKEKVEEMLQIKNEKKFVEKIKQIN
jgi:mannitol/fructose-specific phosphotransferase system IIA component (Ntr-type)